MLGTAFLINLFFFFELSKIFDCFEGSDFDDILSSPGCSVIQASCYQQIKMCTKIAKYHEIAENHIFHRILTKDSFNAKVTQQRSQNRLKWFIDFKSVLWNISTAKSAPTHQKPSWVFRYFEFSHHATYADRNRPGCRRLVSSHLWEVLSPKPAGRMLLGPSSQRRQTFARRVWWGETLGLMCLCTIWSKNMQLWPPVSSVEETTEKPWNK